MFRFQQKNLPLFRKHWWLSLSDSPLRFFFVFLMMSGFWLLSLLFWKVSDPDPYEILIRKVVESGSKKPRQEKQISLSSWDGTFPVFSTVYSYRNPSDFISNYVVKNVEFLEYLTMLGIQIQKDPIQPFGLWSGSDRIRRLHLFS